MAIERSHTSPDTGTDPVARVLISLRGKTRNTTVYKQEKERMLALLSSLGYVEFTGSGTRDLQSRIGQSMFYDVPLKRRGSLSKFRGMVIRVVCVGISPGGSGRRFMAGPV